MNQKQHSFDHLVKNTKPHLNVSEYTMPTVKTLRKTPVKRCGTRIFDFREYEDAFKCYKDYYAQYNGQVQMVICSSGYISGYWVEPLHEKLTEGDVLYVGDEVTALEARVRAAIEARGKQAMNKVIF